MSLSLVVLDTNILVSAGLRADGHEAQVLNLVLENALIMLTCPDIVLEYQDVFHRPKFHRFGFPPLWLSNLLKLAHHHTENPAVWPIPGPDPDDLVFLALAHSMEATLVTGNLKHYPLEMRREVMVLNAREFLEHYQHRAKGLEPKKP